MKILQRTALALGTALVLAAPAGAQDVPAATPEATPVTISPSKKGQ